MAKLTKAARDAAMRQQVVEEFYRWLADAGVDIAQFKRDQERLAAAIARRAAAGNPAPWCGTGDCERWVMEEEARRARKNGSGGR
jgi:hypothetical protein